MMLKFLILYLWSVVNKHTENSHLFENRSVKKKVPFIKTPVFLRPSKSDYYRVKEFLSSEYSSQTFLNTRLVKAKPNVLIDLGANIGMSSLKLVEEFPSIKKVIGVEANENNFRVLEKNFSLWMQNSSIEFKPYFSVISSEDNNEVEELCSLYEMSNKEKYTASGTFRFKSLNKKNNDKKRLKTISMNKILSQFASSDKIIVKMDIEGGEETVFSQNTEWLGKIVSLSVETHDHYHEELINSSRNLLKKISEYNFSLCPKNNILIFYNMEILGDRYDFDKGKND